MFLIYNMYWIITFNWNSSRNLNHLRQFFLIRFTIKQFVRFISYFSQLFSIQIYLHWFIEWFHLTLLLFHQYFHCYFSFYRFFIKFNHLFQWFREYRCKHFLFHTYLSENLCKSTFCIYSFSSWDRCFRDIIDMQTQGGTDPFDTACT